MKLTGRIADVNISVIDGTAKLTLEVNERNGLKDGFDELNSFPKLDIELKKHRKKRSLNANAYMWVLCGKLAEKIGCSSVDVYRQHIIDSGIYTTAEVNEKAVNTVMTAWRLKGKGWLAEKLDSGAHAGFELIILYYGSSVYNTKQMSRLLDSVIEDCKEQGIQTLTPNELARMKATWKAERIEVS